MGSSSGLHPTLSSHGEFGANSALGSSLLLQTLAVSSLGFAGFMLLWLLGQTTVRESSLVLARIITVVALSYVLMVYTDDIWPG
ncbi:unnamed protein product [Polarella glacialis]|nr:unnamed protein product [Polarella glacialis]|eukprot:CAMPEP_0115060616 /NCGR_PEP_ID=MMETSP0227-20121206/7559_1 /TAXON_ID=89957 /ORGANISM="Polarella glacialis, Strain CCMP 1383" /LENGTH=83 /DNA_ID=CAMNT_0002445843 /DNA_START=77 /DNA_END=328 /DNA_ORIENTATION=-